MAVYQFENKIPKIGAGTYVYASADIIGDVTIGENCYIGPGARIRGDYGTVKIGNETSVEDNCVIHARPDEICTIGDHVTIGHGAIIHNCTVGDWCIIGMSAVVSDYAKLGEWCVVAEGCVVKNNQEIPGGKIAVGIPAKVIGDVSSEYKAQWTKFKNIYKELAVKRYPKGLKLVP